MSNRKMVDTVDESEKSCTTALCKTKNLHNTLVNLGFNDLYLFNIKLHSLDFQWAFNC